MDVTSVIVDPEIPDFENPVGRKIKARTRERDELQGLEGEAYVLENDKGRDVSVFHFFCIPFRYRGKRRRLRHPAT